MSASLARSMRPVSGYGSLLAALGRGSDNIVAHISPREAALLKALGGRGSINPRTGLPEYDNPQIGTPPVSTSDVPGSLQDPGAGAVNFYTSLVESTQGVPGQPVQDPSSGLWYNAQGGSFTGASPPPDFATQPYQEPQPTTPTVDPAQEAWAATQFGNLQSTAGGGAGNPFLYDPSFMNPGGGNADFSQNPTTGYYDLTPAGIAALQTDYTQGAESVAANAEKSQGGIGGFLGSPEGALATLAFPLAVGGGVAGISSAFDVPSTTGGFLDATTGALTPTTSTADAAALAAASDPEMLATVPATSASDLAAASGPGLATSLGFDPTAFGATDLTAATQAADPFAANFAADPTGVFGAAPAAANTAGAAADPFAANFSADPTGFAGAVAPGGTDFASAGGLPAQIAGATPDTTGPIAGGGGIGAVTDNTPIGFGTDTFGSLDTSGGANFGETLTTASGDTIDTSAPGFTAQDLVNPDLGQGQFGPATAEGGQPGFWSNPVGNSLNWLGTQAENAFSKNPLGILASAAGLGYTLLQGNKQLPNQTALQGTANQESAAGTALENQVLSGQNPQVNALNSTAQQLLQQASVLQNQVASGNLPLEGAPQALSNANYLTAQARNLMSYLTTGTLPPGVQASVDQAAAAAKASIRSAYAQRGMSGSSAEAQDLSNVDTNKASQGAQIAMSLYSQGQNDVQLADNLYGVLVNASTSLMQVSTSEANLGLQGQEAATQTSTNLLNLALNETSLGANINQSLLATTLQEDQQLGSALASFSAALAGGGSRLALLNLGSQSTGVTA